MSNCSDTNSDYINSNSESISQSSDEDITQTNNLDLNSKIINNYNIIYELGRGSYSIVWLAYNINNQKFYALKVQNPSEYEEGLDEIKFVKKLPNKPSVFNNIYENFVENIDNINYLCSVWNLHCGNIDSLIRKGKFKSGLPLESVKYIMKQLISAVKILHHNFKVFHGDIKTDNILIKGLNDKDAFMISEYTKEINIVDNNKDRQKNHEEIINKIINNFDNHSIDSKYLENINISLADFGTFCSQDNYYDESFGTRYYQAPEIILMGKCSFPVDIWALGCTLYELITGELLFDPNKDLKYSRDYYHLCLINNTCGNFSKNFLKKTKHYKNFFNSKYNIIDQQNSLNNKLKINKFNEQDNYNFNILLCRMLEIDPTKRITINELYESLLLK